MGDFKIDPDYVEVSARIDDLYEKFPNAVLEGEWTSVALGANAYIVYTARCWRTPDDPRPSIGIAMEEMPGKTPYTRGSEIQNAETSAWGRAIVAAGASRSKRIASADEMRSAQARQGAPARVPAPKDRVEECKQLIIDRDLTEWIKAQGYEWPWTAEECGFIELYAQNQPGPNAKPLEEVMTRLESKAKPEPELPDFPEGEEPF